MASGNSRLGRLDTARFVPAVVRRRFVRKVVVAVLAAMVVAGSIGGVLYVDATSTVDRQVESRVVSTAELQADGMDSWVDGFSRQTRTLSSIQEFQEGQPEVIKDYLALEAGELTSSFVAVHYVQASDGTVEASTASGVRGQRLSGAGQPWANDSAAVDTETDRPDSVYVHSQPYTSPATGDKVLAFISSPPQNTEHVVVVEANLSTRANAFHQGMDGGETTILGASRRTVVGEPLADNGTVPAGAGTQSTSGFNKTSDTVVGYATVESLGWTVVTRVPTSSAYAMRNQMRSSLLLTLLSALVVLGGVTLVVGRRSGKALETLSRKADAMRRGELDVTLETERADEIGRLFDAFDGMRDSLREQIADAEAAREQAETAKRRAESARAEADEARERAQELNDRLESTAEEYADVMAACAEGDLTQRMDDSVDNEAMALVAAGYNDVMDEWETTIREVRSFSDAVQSANAGVSDTVETVRSRSNDVRDAVVEMAEGADEQSDELGTVLAELEELSATVEEMAATADSVRQRADEALDRSREGRDAATDAAGALEEIATSTDRAVTEVEQLEELMSDIESVTDLISDIADQTTMLALNANIEAARADADGDGFAVVADEVKSLADETVEATADIEASIERMRGQVERTVGEIHDTQRKVDTGTETVGDALAAFDSIVADIEAATGGMRDIDGATDDQAESTQEVVTMVETVGDISTRTADQAAGIAETTNEQVAAVGAVEDEVVELADQAGDLQQLLATFDIDSDDTVVFDPSETESVIEQESDAAGSDRRTVRGDGSGD